MYVIGLTGGIACGKTTASSTLQQLGACILDADRLAHELAVPGGILYSAYVEHFGESILTQNGTLDRKAVGERVFCDPEEREWMDQLAQPILFNEMKNRLESCRMRGEHLVILDVPLLLEAGWDVLCDEIWVIFVPRHVQRERLMSRDHLTKQQADARMDSQMDPEEKCRRADVVIDNSGGEDLMKEKIKALYEERSSSVGVMFA